MMYKALIAFWICLCITPAFGNPCALPDKDLFTRPVPGEGPTSVWLRLYVNDIISIHDVDQSFVGDVFFRADWNDPRLVHSDSAPCSVSLQNIWDPGLQLLNRRHLERLNEPDLLVAPDGGVTMVLRSYGEFSFRADLSDFPFDRQELSFKVVSSHEEDAVRLLTKPEFLGMAQELSVANWRVQMGGTRSLTQSIPPVNKHLVRLDLVLDAQRLTGYYTWQQLLPLLLVVMMTWVVFWIPQEFVPPRVGLAATSMLTLIAYRFAMSSVLPPIAYLTRLDVFMIGASILVFAGLATAVAVTYLADSHHQALANRVNRAARWLSPLGLAVVAGWAYFV
jgi:hypothetical protein